MFPCQSSQPDNTCGSFNHDNVAAVAAHQNSLLLPAPPPPIYQDSSDVVLDMQNDFQSLVIYGDPNVYASNYYNSSSPSPSNPYSPSVYFPNTSLPPMISQPISQSFTPITISNQPFVTQSVFLTSSTSQSVFKP